MYIISRSSRSNKDIEPIVCLTQLATLGLGLAALFDGLCRVSHLKLNRKP